MLAKESPRTNRQGLCHGLVWLKQASCGWLVLWFAFLAGASAGSLGQGLYWRLFTLGVVEGHQAILAHQAGDQFTGKIEKQIVSLFAGLKLLPVLFDHAIFQTHAEDWIPESVSYIYIFDGFPKTLWADDRERGALVGEQISDSDLDLAELIAQRHSVYGQPQSEKRPIGYETGIIANFSEALNEKIPTTIGQRRETIHTPNLFKAALRYRQFHIFQNQFTSMFKSSCLRDAHQGTNDTRFGSKSSPSTILLKSPAHFRFSIAPTREANAL